MQARALPEFITPDVGVVWEEGPEPQVAALHVAGGSFTVDHQLPPEVETPLLLRVAGLTRGQVADRFTVGDTNIRLRCNAAASMLRTPQVRSHLEATVGRLCVPGGILQVEEAMPGGGEPDSYGLAILRALGRGSSWEQAGYRRSSVDAIENAARRHYQLTPVTHTALRRRLLLHAYSNGFLASEEIVAEQDALGLPLLPRPERRFDSLTLHPAPRIKAPETPKVAAAPEENIEGTEGTENENNKPSGIPEAFLPFHNDRDTRLWLRLPQPGEYSVAGIESFGADFVVRQGEYETVDGRPILLQPRQALALSLVALGAYREETSAYALSDFQLSVLFRQLGINGSDAKSGILVTRWVCDNMLTALRPPDLSPSLANNVTTAAQYLTEYYKADDQRSATLSRNERWFREYLSQLRQKLDITRRSNSLFLLLAHGLSKR